jgi:predicted transcriptional regulator
MGSGNGTHQTPGHITRPAEDQSEVYLRRARAAELRRHGWKWDDIAAEVGYADKASAYGAVRYLLKEHQSLAYDQIGMYRQESLDRLTDLLKVAMDKALKGDEKMMTQARLIIAQIGDLTGEKAPMKLQLGESDVDRLLRDAVDEFNRRAADLDHQGQGIPADQAGDG